MSACVCVCVWVGGWVGVRACPCVCVCTGPRDSRKLSSGNSTWPSKGCVTWFSDKREERNGWVSLLALAQIYCDELFILVEPCERPVVSYDLVLRYTLRYFNTQKTHNIYWAKVSLGESELHRRWRFIENSLNDFFNRSDSWCTQGGCKHNFTVLLEFRAKQKYVYCVFIII